MRMSQQNFLAHLRNNCHNQKIKLTNLTSKLLFK